ncbi:MAG: Crp/Fnr family transcriptional regulator [Chlorobiota bacterium]|jgi:CRP/FNR family transcriptional regulator|nr:Crp/Fnr family transcriptional regulator [Chlorobiota bacterium]QQS66361.1 MAG: Crp/Fnr family transcriptional regulator [Chlorobiota bacterium]
MEILNNSLVCNDCESRGKSIFCGLLKNELAELMSNKGCTKFLKGQTIFKEGMYPFGLYCVKHGKVKLSKLGERGKEQILRLAKDSDVIGYRSLIVNEPYRATAQAMEDSTICFIPKSYFLTMLKSNPELSNQMLIKLSNDLKEAENKIVGMAQKPIRERLAETLINLKECYGTEDDNKTLNVIFTREELANIVGTATESLIRILHEFKEENLISLNGKKIEIINGKKLLFIAKIDD